MQRKQLSSQSDCQTVVTGDFVVMSTINELSLQSPPSSRLDPKGITGDTS